MISPTKPLLQSLVEGPLLIDDLPEASSFAHHQLELPTKLTSLNLQQKLGHLCEDALAILLEASPRFDLLARNLQIRTDAQTTLGELDFLLRDLGNDQLIHLELASKFYLAVETPSGLSLPGPDARDNYFRKLQRLRSHQLLLTRKHRSSLPEVCRHQSIVARQLIYGCLFDHINAPKPATPAFIHPNCRRGRWLSIGECFTHFASDTEFQIIPKALWPVPLPLIEEFPLQRWNPQTRIERCMMLRANGDPTPYFITPGNFPDQKNNLQESFSP